MQLKHLVRIELDKIKLFFLFPIIVYIGTYFYTNSTFINAFSSATTTEFSIMNSFFLPLFLIGTLLIFIEYFQFKEDNFLFNAVMPISKKNLILSRIISMLIFSCCSYILFALGFFKALSDSYWYVSMHEIFFSKQEIYFRIFLMLLSVFLFFLVISSAVYFMIFMMFTLVRNKIIGLLLGSVMFFIPIALVVIFEILIDYRNSNLLSSIYFTLPYVIIEHLNFCDVIPVTTIDNFNKVLTNSDILVLTRRAFKFKDYIYCIYFFVVACTCFLIGYKNYFNQKYLSSESFIIYPLAKKIFCVCSGILCSVFGIYLKENFSYPMGRVLNCIVFFIIGMAIGIVIIKITSNSKEAKKNV